MTKLMEEAIDLLRNIPPELQDELAQVIMQLTGREPQVYELTPEEDADIAASEAAAARGEFATDGQIKALWTKHGL